MKKILAAVLTLVALSVAGIAFAADAPTTDTTKKDAPAPTSGDVSAPKPAPTVQTPAPAK